jgi:hypothetical protein
MARVQLIVIAWLAFMATTSAWVPAYKGELGPGDYSPAVGFYVVIAALAAVGLRTKSLTERRALMSSLPALALVAAAAVAAYIRNSSQDGFGTQPLFLYFAIALWTSWAALIVTTAMWTRTRWTDVGLGLTILVAFVGFLMATFGVN